MSQIELRAVGAADRAAWAALWRDYLAFYGTTRDAGAYDAGAPGAPAVCWTTRDGDPARALYDRVAERTDFVKYVRRLPA